MNPGLHRVASRLAPPGSRARRLVIGIVYRAVAPLCSGPPPGLRSGRHAAPPPTGLPVVLVVLLGADDAAAGRLAERVAGVQWAAGGFTPVFVVDRPVMAPLRRAGYAVEHHPAGVPDVAERLARHRRTYATDAVVVVPAAAVDRLDLAVLAGVTVPVARREPPRPVRALTIRLERLLDSAAAS